MLIDNTNKRLYSFNELTPGVYRTNDHESDDYVVYIWSKEHGELTEEMRYRGIFLILPNGDIQIPIKDNINPEMDWESVKYVRIADTMNFVIPGTKP